VPGGGGGPRPRGLGGGGGWGAAPSAIIQDIRGLGDNRRPGRTVVRNRNASVHRNLSWSVGELYSPRPAAQGRGVFAYIRRGIRSSQRRSGRTRGKPPLGIIIATGPQDCGFSIRPRRWGLPQLPVGRGGGLACRCSMRQCGLMESRTCTRAEKVIGPEQWLRDFFLHVAREAHPRPGHETL